MMVTRGILLARRYLDAAANMRAKQLAYRMRRLLPIGLLAPRSGDGAPPGWQPFALGTGGETAPSSGPRRPPHEDGVFRAFGVERSLDDPALWGDASDGLLFLFHLHGFQDLAEYAGSSSTPDGDEFWSEAVASWLERCAKPGLPAWHPYPMSGRIIAWCAALSREGLLGGVREPMLASLWRQLRTLRRAVEHDVGGNHVLRNAAALVIGGVCLRHGDTQRRGMRLLSGELTRQVLADGGHEERSPCYHRLVLGDLRDVATVLDRSGSGAPSWLTEAAGSMEAWLRAIAGPRGEVPPMNDGWDGPPLVISDQRPELEVLAPSGYLALRDGGAQAVLDAAPVSPANLPAHAHADVLSLVLWADGEPVLIDPGSGAYAGALRGELRGTAAHTTVQVDGLDQFDLWGTFRAAGLPRVRLAAVDRHRDGAVLVRACHDGYRRLADPVVHERTFVWLGADGIAVLDRLLCAHAHDVVSRLQFADGIAAPLEDDLPGGLRFSPLGNAGPAASRLGRRSPFIGQTRPIAVIEMSASVRPGERFGWLLAREGVELRLGELGVELVRPGRPVLKIGLPPGSADG